MKTFYTTTEIARALKVSTRAARKRAEVQSWPREQRGRGYVYPIHKLPDDVRKAVLLKHVWKDILDQNGINMPSADFPPDLLYAGAVRAALVNLYDVAVLHAREQGMSKGEAKEQFVKAWNTGLLHPELFKEVGKRSRDTLDRWSRKLRENHNDCSVLAPRQGRHLKGRCKVSDQERKLLLGFLLRQERMKIGTAIRFTRWVIERDGGEVTSSPATMRRFVENFKKQHADIWTLSRYGEKALKDRSLPYVIRDDKELEVGDCLVADGHPLNFRVINPFTGKPCRASLIGWQDWASRDILGYTIMLTEDVFAIHEALRRAIMRLGKIPKAVLLDNGRAFKANAFTAPIDLEAAGVAGLYASLGVKTFFAKPYNARSKVIERFFGTFGNWFERLQPSYSGSSIDDKPARMKRNEKFMQEISPDRPLTIDEAYSRVDQWLDEFYRIQPHSGLDGATPGEVFVKGRGPGIDADRLRFLMMCQERRKLHRNGVTFLGGQYWDDALYGLEGWVKIRYDLRNVETICIYDESDQFLTEARRIEKVHPLCGLLEGEEKEKSYSEVKRQLKTQKKLLNETKTIVKKLAQVGNIAALDQFEENLPWDALSETAPELPDVLEQARAEADTEPQGPPEPTIDIDDFNVETIRPGRKFNPAEGLNDLDGEALDRRFQESLAQMKERRKGIL